MTNDNTRTKANAVFFSVLMVLSMVAVGFAAAPAAATAGNNSDDIRPQTGSPTKTVNSSSPGTATAIVFQGESVTFGSEFTNVESVTGVSGDAEGQVIDLNRDIPQDQAPGTYSANGTTPINNSTNPGFTVLEPSIDTAEVQYDGNDIDQVASNNAIPANLTIFAEWNFAQAENISLTVEDSSGREITNQVLSDSTLTNVSDGTDSVGLNLREEDAGEYTVIFEGATDLDYSAVVEEYTIETTNEDTLGLELATDTTTQGDNLEYTVSGGQDAQTHVIAIEQSDFRDGVTKSQVLQTFRNVGDTNEVGVWETNNYTSYNPGNTTFTQSDVEYAYAVVEIDGTQAIGQIETQYLDDSGVDVYLHSDGTPNNRSDMTEEDDPSFTNEEGDVTLDSPVDSYTVGQDVDVSGTAASADTVGIYVRDNNNWQPASVDGSDVAGAQEINVDSDDTFEETDVTLSNSSATTMRGSQILSFAGRYDIGVVDMSDVNDNSASLTTSQFSSASSNRYSLTVTEGDLSAEFGTINGQIAQEDGLINVEGTASGQDEVVVAFVDRRGNTVEQTVTVDSDDTFSEEDIDISGLDQGAVSAHVISLGRDAVVGDGSDLGTGTDGSADELVNFISGLSGSGDQVRSRILANTVDADGSDDLIVSETFRLNDATISVRNVYPDAAQADGVNPVATGETMVVEGDTNRRSDDASVTLDVLDENDDAITSGSVDEWGADGQFSINVDTTELETGSYVVEVDDGESTDRVTVEIVEERDTGAQEEEQTQEDTSEEEQTQEDTSEDTSSEDTSSEDTSSEDTSSEDTSSEDTSSEEESTDDSTPGFGALVALVALVAAALLATRRRDE